jgi:16S rRNA (cytidine1402-2'-O)-methyltransferase
VHPVSAVPKPLAPALYMLATPIGAARDITLRALDILASADVLAAEDTRTMRHLMEIHGLSVGTRRLVSYHDHNGAKVRPRLIAALAAGQSVAYASEAGTPLVADPGYDLARAASEAGHTVIAAPGASAVLAALTVSGLPTDRFLFAGFPPSARNARRTWLAEFAAVPATLVFYESPKRIGDMLADAVSVLGGDRQAAVCRELTKRFEEVTRGALSELAEVFGGQSVKGEIAVVVDRGRGVAMAAGTVEEALRTALATHSVKDAAMIVAQALGVPKREVYQVALRIGGE